MPDTDAAAVAAAAVQSASDATAVIAAANAKAITDAAAAAQTTGNEENKFRRLHEAAELKRTAAEARVAELEAAEKVRTDANLSELEREKARATDLELKVSKAEERAAAMEHEQLRARVAAAAHLTAEAMELLTGADEASLTANAAKLAAIMKQPATAGSITAPAGGQAPSIAEQILAAQKAGNTVEGIRLKRSQAFGDPAS